MNEHHDSGVKITYRLRNILEINGRILESVYFSPKALGEVVELIDDDLRAKMADEEAFNREYRPTTSRSKHAEVLIARLALEDQPFMALNKRALQSGEYDFTHPSVLTEEAFPYWTNVASTGFQPHVHNLHSTNRSTAGVWLGVSET